MSFWRVNKSVGNGDLGLVDLEIGLKGEKSNDWEKLLDMQVRAETNLIASAISGNAKWVACADWDGEVKAWAVDFDAVSCIYSHLFNSSFIYLFSAKNSSQTDTSNIFHANPWRLIPSLHPRLYQINCRILIGACH